jgi:hypothetical protein
MKRISTFGLAVLMSTFGVMASGCSSTSSESTTQATSLQESESTSVAPAVKEFSITLPAGLQDWDYCFVTVNAFGDDPGVGMINIDNWGNKKLKLGTNGVCAGTGSIWTISLNVKDASTYELDLSSKIIGDDVAYSKSGVFSYSFKGPYTSSVSNNFALAAPTYCKVSLTGEFTRLTDGSDFADYIPSAPWNVDSCTADTDASVTAIKSKVLPSLLLTSVFSGATFVVEGETISSVIDID